MCIKRIVDRISDEVRKNKQKNVILEIPSVGVFICKNKVIGVKYNDYLIQDIKVALLILANFIFLDSVNIKLKQYT